MHIKRFDPSNPNSFALVVKAEEKEEKADVHKKKKQKTEKQTLLEEGRLQVLNKRNQNEITLQEQKKLLVEKFENQAYEQEGDGEKRSI